MKFCVLASGSSGNSIYVASNKTALLVDAGLSGTETVNRLKTIGEDISSVKAVCITHEHSDHVSGIGVLQKKYGVELYANSGTIEGITNNGKFKELRWNIFSTGQAFNIGDLKLEPFTVPHDSYDPVGFIVSDGKYRMGIVTDMGIHTNLIREKLKRCSILVIEANHDQHMLKDSKRPWSLKQRIAGIQGHLSNEQASELLAEVASEDLKTVFLAHLSSECNTPEAAIKKVREGLKRVKDCNAEVKMTYPDKPAELIEVP